MDAVAADFLVNLIGAAPALRDAAVVTYLDSDDTVKATHGYTKQGTGYGYSGIKSLNALIATVSTPISAPLIAATRLWKGSANSARGAARLIGDALATTKRCGATALVILRADSADYNHDVVAAAARGRGEGLRHRRMNPAVVRAISTTTDSAWTPIQYPNAIWDEDEQRLISDAEVAEVAETPFTAFTSRRLSEQRDGRLIVRRVKRLNPASVPDGQGELFATYRHHAVFTDTALPMLQAETTHRGHAVIEQVHADLKAGPLAHLPSSSFSTNGAWLALAAVAFNLTRAAGAIASVFHAKATTATIRRHLITVPARIATSARRLTLHLPRDWPWQDGWEQLFASTCGPPTPAKA